jgi:hypothetical protein
MPTIRTATDRILATVAAFGHVKDGNYGPYQSVLFESPDLPEGKVWRSMKPEEAKTFDKGQQAYLVPTTNKQGKPSWDIELLPTAQPQAAPMPTATPGSYAAGPAPTIPDDRKRQIAQYLQDLAALYAYSYSTAKHQLEPHDAPAEAIQGAATTLFIQASRKFNL